MSRQLDQALLSLMPTYGSDLPPSLVDLASSLLAQSRLRASTLKSEEEVARLYACSHLACDRLKISLDLPPIDPRPPIPPRIYRRLYTHLDSILPSQSTPKRAGSVRKRAASAKAREDASSPATPTRRLPSRATPSKETTLKQFNSQPKDPERASSNALPPWIHPATRFFCKESGHQKLISTILAGMELIVTPSGRRTDDGWSNEHMTSLFAAIYFFVIMRAKAITTGETVDREAYVPQRKEILKLLNRAREELSINDVDDEVAWEAWTSINSRDFDAAVAQVNDRDWLTADWFKAIPDVLKSQEVANEDMAEDDEELSSQAQVKRADTMFQDKYDYLSEARRSEYKIWKETMLSKISELKASGGAMEIDT